MKKEFAENPVKSRLLLKLLFIMILKYTGSNDWGRSELDYGTRVYVPTNWRTNDLGNVSKAAIPEIRESLRDMGIRLSFNNDPFAVACFDDVLLFWEKA